MRATLEVVAVPVTDVDRAKAFYAESLGFSVDVDYAPADGFRVVQLTPPESAASFQLGVGVTAAAPGSLRGVTLVVTDLEAAVAELTSRGVDVRAIRHKSSIDDWDGSFAAGLDPSRAGYASFADVVDPDGNVLTLQERR